MSRWHGYVSYDCCSLDPSGRKGSCDVVIGELHIIMLNSKKAIRFQFWGQDEALGKYVYCLWNLHKHPKFSYWLCSHANSCSFEECMHNVSRVQTEDISLVNVRLGMMHSSCLQTWISRRKYCGGQRHRHVQPFRETMQVVRSHWWAAVRLRDEKHARTSSADTFSKARGHAHANVPNRSAESHLKNHCLVTPTQKSFRIDTPPIINSTPQLTIYP